MNSWVAKFYAPFLQQFVNVEVLGADTAPVIGSGSYLTDKYQLTGPSEFIGNLTLQCTWNFAARAAQFVNAMLSST